MKNRRRVTWIALQQNTQVQELTDGVLTLVVDNPGALETLQRGGSDDIIREAILEVAGLAPRIAIVAGDAALAALGFPPVQAPASSPPRAAPGASARAEQAKANIVPTRVGGAEEPEEEPDRDDEDLDDEVAGSDELLVRYLGAELIGEEEPG